MRFVTVLAISAVALALVSSAYAQAPERVPPPFIAVTGEGEVQIPPDLATVQLGVESTSPSAQTAQGEVSERVQQILRRIRALGIPEEQIRTTRLTLLPVYAGRRPDESGEQRVVGYRATNIVQVEVRDLELAGPVIDAGLAGGANRVEGLTYGLRDDSEPRLRALRQAAAEARRKAAALASALDVGLGPPLEVQEGGGVIVPRFEMARAAGGAVETPVQPGLITVRANVSVRYRLIANKD
ncbi:MAG: SIMPL domain-containing protein [Armatimonadetes bacterium]|nr:SIMPL domain-containing protein [Armatimonadota bacterium]